MDATEQAVNAIPEVERLQRWIALQSGFHRLTDRLFGEVTDRTGLPASSIQILLLLLQNQPYHSVQMTHLAHSLEFSTAGITKVTDRLLQAGFIERSPCVTDRRVVRATLTGAGREVAESVAKILSAALDREIVSKIGEEEFSRLASIVATLDGGRYARQ